MKRKSNLIILLALAILGFTLWGTTVSADKQSKIVYRNGPGPDFSATDSFTFKANAVNNAPVAVDDGYTIPENTGIGVGQGSGVLSNDKDADGNTLSAILVSPPSHAQSFIFNQNGSFNYRPNTNFSGTDTFTYKANDGQLDSNTATVTMTVKAVGSFHFSAESYTVDENAGGAVITVERTGGGAGFASLLFSTSNGTASSSDYIPVSQTLSFAEGETTKTIKVPVTDDSVYEGDETIFLRLTNASGSGQLGIPTNATLTIKDDDLQLPTLSINDVMVVEGNAGASVNAVLSVRLSGASNQTVKVDYASAQGTAQAGTDYTSASGTLIFAPGETEKTVALSIQSDTLNEPDETFFVNLSNPVNATISDNQGSVTILNDDAPAVQFSSDSYTFSEDAGHGDIIVKRTGDLSSAISVDYQTNDQSALVPCQTTNTGLASERCDYATAVGTLMFAAGEAQKTIPLILINDAYIEGPEQLSIKLSNPQGASLGSVESSTVIITDNDVQVATENPVDNLSFFIRQLYIDFLGREPEQAGFQFWKDRMTGQCPVGQQCDRTDTAFRFFGSDEFRERGYFVYLFYDAALGRRPTYSEWIVDVSKLNGPKTVPEQEASKARFINEFMSRQQFMNLYEGSRTGQTFVDALVQKSGIAPASRQQLIDNYATVGRAATLRAFLETPEVQSAFVDRAFVAMLYYGFLRRDAEAGGFDFWMQKLESTNHDNRFLIGGFLQSDEYRFRFARLPLAP